MCVMCDYSPVTGCLYISATSRNQCFQPKGRREGRESEISSIPVLVTKSIVSFPEDVYQNTSAQEVVKIIGIPLPSAEQA